MEPKQREGATLPCQRHRLGCAVVLSSLLFLYVPDRFASGTLTQTFRQGPLYTRGEREGEVCQLASFPLSMCHSTSQALLSLVMDVKTWYNCSTSASTGCVKARFPQAARSTQWRVLPTCIGEVQRFERSVVQCVHFCQLCLLCSHAAATVHVAACPHTHRGSTPHGRRGG